MGRTLIEHYNALRYSIYVSLLFHHYTPNYERLRVKPHLIHALIPGPTIISSTTITL